MLVRGSTRVFKSVCEGRLALLYLYCIESKNFPYICFAALSPNFASKSCTFRISDCNSVCFKKRFVPLRPNLDTSWIKWSHNWKNWKSALGFHSIFCSRFLDFKSIFGENARNAMENRLKNLIQEFSSPSKISRK